MTPLGRIIAWPFVQAIRLAGLARRFVAWPFTAIAAIPCDKIFHIWIGTTLAMSGLWLGWYGALPVIIYAVGKEFWDSLFPQKHTADLWDAVATISGGGISLGLIQLHRIYP